MSRNLYLIGYMGTGKSTIGRELSGCLGAKLIDMDAKIEEEEGRKISDIFAQSGEEAFRDMETDLLRRLSQQTDHVVSCGGGVPLRPENVDIMRSTGTVIWLDARPETVYNRIRHSKTRPLLADNMSTDYIANMMAGRRPAYEKAATHRIDVDNVTIEEIVSQILKDIR